MVGIVVVSHSKNLADELIKLASEMQKSDFPLINGSGIEGDHFGSDPMKIKESIENAYLNSGVIIFVDIGSSVLNSEIAIEFLDDEKYDKNKIRIADAPLVEGLISILGINDEKADLDEIINELNEFKTFSKI